MEQMQYTSRHTYIPNQLSAAEFLFVVYLKIAVTKLEDVTHLLDESEELIASDKKENCRDKFLMYIPKICNGNEKQDSSRVSVEHKAEELHLKPLCSCRALPDKLIITTS
jgi:hypothetical protein